MDLICREVPVKKVKIPLLKMVRDGDELRILYGSTGKDVVSENTGL